MNKPMLSSVLDDLAACKGQWAEIARELEPDNTVSFYSWLTKLAQGAIREPSVNRIQRLYDYFRGRSRQVLRNTVFDGSSLRPTAAQGDSPEGGAR